MNARALAVLLIASLPLAADLSKAMAERNLEKRSKLALENAQGALKQARAAYNKGDLKHVAADLGEMQESVTLADTSLQQTGKNPRKSPKWFKRAEIQTRDLLRKLDAFSNEMSYQDRDMIKGARQSIQDVHERLLEGIMEGKK